MTDSVKKDELQESEIQRLCGITRSVTRRGGGLNLALAYGAQPDKKKTCGKRFHRLNGP